jgi:hypothetical protein
MSATTCPYCHLPADADHDADVSRCKIIARAFYLQNANMGDEVSYQIVTLATWLCNHDPSPRTSKGRRAREDRQAFLDHYIKLAQKEEERS